MDPRYPGDTTQNIVVLQQEKAAKRFLNVVRNKVNDLSQKLWGNSQQAFLDQHAGKAVPFCFSKWYGPIEPQTQYRLDIADGGNDFTENAPIADERNAVLPRNKNIIVNREGAFYLTSWNFCNYVNHSSVRPPNLGGVVPTPGVFLVPPPNPTVLGDIFDSAIENNGGAFISPVSSTQIGQLTVQAPRIFFELEFYDRKRGRLFHPLRFPMELLDGFAVENKRLADPIRFDPDTEIEPRLFINSATLSPDLYDQATNPYAFYINIMFKGYKLLEVE
jgi:hypothetical protein